jgi:tripartite ATP-independent transporter DctM subunit
VRIIYGIFAETSITRVFLGGISVGILTALSYVVVVLLFAWLRPDIVPRRRVSAISDDAEEAPRVWPIVALVLLVFGGLFGGLFTATEAGAIGALGAILISLAAGRLTREVLRRALLETLMTSASLFIIGIGASMFTRFLGVTGLSSYIAAAVSGADLGYLHLMLIIVLIYLALGMIMEPFGSLLVTLPVLLPVLRAEGISLVWFGVLVVKLLEIGMITPPVGLNVFVIRNVAAKYATVVEIFRGVTPFLLADLVIVVLIVAVPSLILFLPDLLG